MTRLLLLTDRHQLPPGRDLVTTVARCSEAGLTVVVLRELDLPEDRRTELALLLAHHVRVIAARRPLPGTRGVHLAAHQPVADAGDAGTLGRSCHHEDEVERAVAQGADYVTISPVAISASKPGYGPPIGVAGVRRAVAVAGDVPVLALGGADVGNVRELRAAGAHGLAVMGVVMRAPDPAAVIEQLLVGTA
ncbi:thiamine phosphate synthase [Aeromicrobium sp.]|uniref:thiamine phosphate synthase n=1 Tax=Aeromicrobium sp. TaxID=1871063 RepID=UPI0019A34F4C|nr:thiamine phosphate synthase [Aeromicrobium sp.]MBC7631511.1 thiamine phosphate synthase [Aeromicrobium sp.]